MITYACYDSVGRITESGYNLAENISPQAGEALVYTEGVTADPSVSYIVDGSVAPRPQLEIEASGNTLTGVPLGAVIIIEGQTYTATSATVELEFTLPGTYEVKIERWPYITEVLTVEN